MAAIGDVDEANCAVGLARAALAGDGRGAFLARISNELFDLGADLATPGAEFDGRDGALRIRAEQVARLESEIDALNAGLPPLRSFVLPGGDAAALHLARAVTRRAERSAVAAAGERTLNPAALAYLNRLSDLLFVLARAVAADGEGDILWQPGATRGTGGYD